MITLFGQQLYFLFRTNSEHLCNKLYNIVGMYGLVWFGLALLFHLRALYSQRSNVCLFEIALCSDFCVNQYTSQLTSLPTCLYSQHAYGVTSTMHTMVDNFHNYFLFSSLSHLFVSLYRRICSFFSYEFFFLIRFFLLITMSFLLSLLFALSSSFIFQFDFPIFISTIHPSIYL